MRYLLKFELEREEISIDYRKVILSFFKAALTQHENGKFFERFYGVGNNKPICWSLRLPRPIFDNDIIKLGGKNFELTLQISDLDAALIYFNSLMEYKNKDFPLARENKLRLKKIDILREVKINGNAVIFEILSPLCLREHDRETNKDYYYSVGNEKFREKLLENIKTSIDPNLVDYVNNLKLSYENMKKVIVKSYGQKIECSIGKLVLFGNNKLLNEIANKSLGSRKNSGFGLLKIIDQWEVS